MTHQPPVTPTLHLNDARLEASQEGHGMPCPLLPRRQ